MPKRDRRPGFTSINLELPDELLAAIDELRHAARRPRTAEIIIALEQYVERSVAAPKRKKGEK